MKTTLLQYVLPLIIPGVLIFFCSCDNNNGNNNDSSKKEEISVNRNKEAVISTLTATEDTLDLSRHPNDITLGNLKIEMSRYTIFIDSTTPLEETLETIHRDAIKNLKTLALNIDNAYTGRYLLAVKINYGINPMNKKMKLFYQPVLLKNITNGIQKTDVIYTVSVSPTYYKYVNSPKPSFVAVGQQTVNVMTEYYRQHITFKRNDNRYYRIFKEASDTDSTADVKSILYTIQELDSLMIGNNVDKIHIFNAVENLNVSGVPYLKHSLILGAERLRDTVSIFYKKYGNLSHLCPPSCNTNKKFNLKVQ